jgi:colanic acid/amylovoran biosynthesis glycosyltransferase
VTHADELVILSPLATIASPRGGFVLTQKFIDGVMEYQKHWHGLVRVLLPRAVHTSNDLDHVEVTPADAPFGLEWMQQAAAPAMSQLRGAAVVLGTLIHEQTELAAQCADALPLVPLVYVTEYSLRTRKQIIAAETSNPLLRLRRQWWTMRLERRYEDAVKLAAGVQCNGTPTFDAYHGLNSSTMLFFDSRVRREMIVAAEALEHRTRELMQGGPLRLAFSGRLIRMKGAHHLPGVALELKQRGVKFTLDICGGGVLEAELRQAIQQHGLSDCVRLRGVLDFQRELVPLVSRSVDLFICCHPQGDPSCTYLETMSCGTPIAGYDNEAFAGIVDVSGVGWSTPMNDPASLAEKIAELDRDREALARAASASRAFASEHTFEETIQRRAAHLRECAEAKLVMA